MKFKLTIDNLPFEVEVKDLHARPIVVTVEGDTFEVWPEAEPARLSQTASRGERVAVPAMPEAPIVSEPTPAAPTGLPVPVPNQGGAAPRVVRAPIPGVITTIAIRPGDQVSVGQELLTLEAMKMNNSIRASFAGRIGAVHIAIGQQVKHNEVLIEYAG